MTPEGEPRFLCGVQHVRAVAGHGGQAVLQQLQEWRFNLLAADADPSFLGHGLPHLAPLALRRADDEAIRTGGALLPDVFDPRFAARCAERVAAVNSGRGLAGYVSDVSLAWAQPPADGSPPARPTLLQVCLGLDARYAAYHAAWEFVLAPHAGDVAALGRAWQVALPNKETLRLMTREEQPLTSPGYLADHARFTREFAQRYFRIAAAAVRQADPGRLFLGAPVRRDAPPEIREAAVAHVDVWMTDGPPAEVAAPVLVVDVDWSDAGVAPDPGHPGLSPLERMHRRGRAFLERCAAHPAVVGYTWAEHVQGDRLTEAPFARGLLYEDGSVAHEHVQPLAAFNAGADALRRAAGAA